MFACDRGYSACPLIQHVDERAGFAHARSGDVTHGFDLLHQELGGFHCIVADERAGMGEANDAVRKSAFQFNDGLIGRTNDRLNNLACICQFLQGYNRFRLNLRCCIDQRA